MLLNLRAIQQYVSLGKLLQASFQIRRLLSLASYLRASRDFCACVRSPGGCALRKFQEIQDWQRDRGFKLGLLALT